VYPYYQLEVDTMRHFLFVFCAAGLVLAGVAGCQKEVETTRKDTVSSPGGTTTTIDKHTVESSGNNPPPNARGEIAK
jgi:hypothetical protein